MTKLLLGVLLWSVVHLLPGALPGVKKSMVARLGENGYKGVFTLAMVVAIYLVISGWKAAVPESVYLPPAWGRHLTALLVLVGFILFFAAYKLYDIYVATGVAIAAAVLQTGLFWLKHRKFEKMHLITLAILIVFGGLTLVLRDPVFIKWKPTIVNWLFAAGFLVAPLFGGKTLPERMMGSNVALQAEQWRRLNLAWVLFFILLGILNLAVAFNFSEAIWVNFKLFGLMGLTVLFALGQGFYIVRHTQDPVD